MTMKSKTICKIIFCLFWILIVPSYAFTSTPKLNSVRCSKYDIFFVIDGSRSIKRHNFKRIKDFIKLVVNSLNMDNEKYHRVGMIQFSEENKPVIEFDYNFTQKRRAVLGKLQTIRYHHGRSSYAGAGFKIVLNSVFLHHIERGDDRRQRLVVFVTDGKAHDMKEATMYASILKSSRNAVRILVINVGKDQFVEDLLKIASHHDLWHTTFYNLPKLSKTIIDIVQHSKCEIKQSELDIISQRRQKRGKCPQEKHDIFFLLDGSRSVQQHNFEKIRRFIITFIKKLEISSNKHQIGLLQFSEEFNYTLEFDFKVKQQKKVIINKLKRINYHLGRSTFTGEALKFVSDHVFNGNFEESGDRNNGENLIILLTDGKAHDLKEAKENARILKRQKRTRIVVIAAGPKIRNHIQDFISIASGVKNFYMAAFSNLRTLIRRIIDSFIEENCTEQLWLGPSHYLHGTVEKTSLRNREMRDERKCDETKQDIVIIVDGSWSTTTHNFDKVKDFLKEFISLINIDPQKTHIAVLQYSQENLATLEINFSHSQYKASILSKISSMYYHDGWATYTGQALRNAQEIILTEENGDRENVQDVIILITHDKPNDPITAEKTIEKLKKEGVHIIVLAVGQNQYSDFYKDIKHYASTSNMAVDTTFEDLNKISEKLSEKLCQANEYFQQDLNISSVTNSVDKQQARGRSKLSPLETSRIQETNWSLPAKTTIPTARNTIPTAKTTILTARNTITTARNTITTAKTTTRIAKTTIPTAKTTIPTAKTTIPTAKTTIPTAKTTIPTAKTTITIAKTTIPTAKTTILTAITTIPTAKTTIPTAKTTIPTAKTTIPTEKPTIPTAKTTITIAKTTIPTAKTTILTAITTIPTAKTTIPTAKTTIPTAKTTIPTEKPTIPTAKTTIPTAKTTIPTEKPIIPTEKTTIPTAKTTIPTEKTTIPTAKTMQQEKNVDNVPGTNSSLFKPFFFPSPSLEPTTREVCVLKKSKDILFMVDSSKAISPTKQKKIKQFLYYILTQLQLRDTGLLAGIMQYSKRHSSKMIMKFSTITADILDMALNNMKLQKSSERYIGDALNQASREFYKVNSRKKRYFNEDIIVLITSGKTHDLQQLKVEVEVLRARNIKLIVIAIGKHRNQAIDEWKTMVDMSYIFSGKIKLLHEIFTLLWEPICSEHYQSVGVGGQTLVCDTIPRDIFFIVDGSSSITDMNFDYIRKLLQDLFILLMKQNKYLNIGMMQFSTAKQTEILLNIGHHSIETMIDTLQSMKYQSGSRTDTGHALKRVYNEVFTKYGGDRPLVNDVVILLTDGNAHDSRLARKMARKLKEKNIKILGIGAGPDSKLTKFKSELEGFVSNKDDIITTDFEHLAIFVTKLLKVTCETAI